MSNVNPAWSKGAARAERLFHGPRRACPCGYVMRVDTKYGECIKCRRANGYRGERPGYRAEYRQLNLQRHSDYENTRRSRKLDRFIEDVDRTVVWARDGGVCHICKLPADLNDWHLEHVVALANGGEHSYANTAVSHPACNMKKGVN